MNDIQVFNNPEFGEIRTVEIGNEPWFVGKDVARALGYAKPENALGTHVDGDDTLKQGIMDSLGRSQNTTLINESGVYSLVMSSKLPTAKKFKRWVTSEVLPSIRKHGAYMTPETLEKMVPTPDFGIRLLTELKAEQDKRKALEATVEEQKPHVLFSNAVSASKTTILIGALAKLLFRPNGTLNPDIVGKPAAKLAEAAGFSVPNGTKVLVAREQEAGPTRPYSMEKLCPVLGFYVLDSEDEVLAKCMEILDFEGRGHTFSIHAEEEQVIRKFAEKIPVSRFLVNVPAALGGIGAETGLFPALTLGCGAAGGSASSNNISPLDLINIRRVAWGREEPKPEGVHSPELVELLAQKILERLEH